MKVGQVCSHGTAAILGQKDQDAQQWQVWARKYNKSMNDATEQLFKDAGSILDEKQMTLLKAWFALGWNPEINNLFYAKELDSVDKAKISDVKKMSDQHEQPKNSTR
jgi:hypothetical protein